MTPLLAEDLLLLCWDDDKGKARGECSSALAPGVGGAVLLDLLLQEAVQVDDQRLLPTGTEPDDPLLAEALQELGDHRRPPKLDKAVSGLGSGRRYEAVRDRLVAQGVLRTERRKALGLFPHTVHPLADPNRAQLVRQDVTALLTGARDPEDADPRSVLLAALTKPTKAVDVLVDKAQRNEARKRAEAFAEGHGVPKAVGQAVQQAQAAAVAAITAAAAASAAASSSSSGSSG